MNSFLDFLNANPQFFSWVGHILIVLLALLAPSPIKPQVGGSSGTGFSPVPTSTTPTHLAPPGKIVGIVKAILPTPKPKPTVVNQPPRVVDWADYQGSMPAICSGISGVIIKHTEGRGLVNRFYQLQVARARKYNLWVGHYLFLDARTDVAAQVQNFINGLLLQKGDGIFLDWEAAGSTQADRDQALALLRQHFKGYRVVLYCNLYFWKHIDTESNDGDGLWIADPSHPAGHPDVIHPWIFQQYGEIKTATGAQDINIGNFTSTDAMRKWFELVA